MNAKEKLPAVVVDSDGMLFCPCCGDQYMHQRAVEVGWRHEDGPVTRHISTPSGVQTDQVAAKEVVYGYRRQYIVVRLECEYCGLGFELQMRQHKGQTILTWVKLPELPAATDDEVDQVAGDLLADMEF